MRTLCLHGMGTSGRIFDSQTAAFRSYLPPTFTFDFPNAPFPSAPAPGIDIIYPEEDCYSFYKRPQPDAVQGAMHWLEEYLADNGPYDAVMCFSQGCALLSSYLLYFNKERLERQQRRLQGKEQEATVVEGEGKRADGGKEAEKDEELPFKCAMFICGGLVLDVLENIGIPVSPKARKTHEETVRLLKQKASRIRDVAADAEASGWRPGVGLWDHTADLMHGAEEENEKVALQDVYGLDLSEETVGGLRIGIPTVHVFGKKDPRFPASLQLAFVCERARREMFEHGGGHDIPRGQKVSERLAELVEWMDEESKV